MLQRRLHGNQLDDVWIDGKLAEFDGGHAVLDSEDFGNLLISEEAKLHKRLAQSTPISFLITEGLLKLLRCDPVFFQQDFTKPGHHGLGAQDLLRRGGGKGGY